MKVVEGGFGKKQEEKISASDLFQRFSDEASELEDKGFDVKVGLVFFVDGRQMQVAGNDTYPDGLYMLLNMGAEAIMSETLGME